MTYSSVAKYVLFGKESAWGTPVSALKDVGIVISDVSQPITREVIESSGVSSIETQFVTSGMTDTGASFAGDYQHGRCLEYVFGTVGHVETTGDWKHTFTISNTPPSATIEIGNDLTTDTVLTGEGLLVESAEIGIALNENLKLSVDWKGENVRSTSSAGTPVLSTLPVFPHALVTVNVNGSPAAEIQNASIAINKIVERSGGVGSNLPQQGHATEIKFEFTLNLGFQDVTFQELFMGGTSLAAAADPTTYEIEIVASNGVALGSGKRELSITLEASIGNNFNEVASIGGLTFIDWTGVGTLKECFSVDNIATGSW